MPIDLSRLGSFNTIASQQGGLESTGIVNLAADGKISSGGTFKAGSLLGRWCRGAGTKALNNFARTQFLKSLGEALNIGGMTQGADGTVTFADDFLQNLKAALGGDPKNVLKLDDFKMKNGQVTSGRPLTERRIAQIVREVRPASFEEGPLARVRLAGMAGAKETFKTFLEKFDAFTAGMNDRQKLVLAFSISQGGLDLAGLIIGDRGAGVAEHTLVRKDDGSVQLTMHIPKEEGRKPHTGISYTFEIRPDGSGKLLDLKVGDDV